MRLSELLPHLKAVEVQGDLGRTFTRVTRDTREVSANALFVAIRGETFDGHDAVWGLDAAAVIAERAVNTPLPVVQVRDSREALAVASAAIHGFPARSLRVVGITGTKGKTTTAALVEGALAHAGRVVGRIGTTGSAVGGVALPSSLTTPDSPELQGLLATMRDRGASDVVMEVSSIGLVQRRVAAIPFHFAIFTNLGRDHLDFHGTVDRYADAKSQLFRSLLRPAGGPVRAALNADDPAHLAMSAPPDHWTYGFADGADLRIVDFASDARGTRFRLHTHHGDLSIRSPLVGRHNAYNLAAAAAACLACGLDVDATVAGLASVQGVPGRLEAVPNRRGVLVLVDYAHTPESLAAVLATAHEITRGRVICVFGCGGDRDPGKRPVMGGVVATAADVAVVTSDNPRTEDPESILAAIVAGMAPPPARVEVDRAAAIAWAIGEARAGDVVLIAGKGHETYQEIAGVKHPFDDRVVAREIP